jgi:DNA-binding YbaB/EbfC family protein
VFKGLGNIQQMMQQAQQMSKKLETVRKELEKREETGKAGGGAVTVKVNGKLEVLSVTIAADLLKEGEVEMLQDLVAVAVNEAIKSMQKIMNTEMGKVTGGMSIPGMF